MLAALLKALPDNFLDENYLSIALQERLPIELHACAMTQVMTVPGSYLAPSLDAIYRSSEVSRFTMTSVDAGIEFSFVVVIARRASYSTKEWGRLESMARVMRNDIFAASLQRALREMPTIARELLR